MGGIEEVKKASFIFCSQPMSVTYIVSHCTNVHTIPLSVRRSTNDRFILPANASCDEANFLESQLEGERVPIFTSPKFTSHSHSHEV